MASKLQEIEGIFRGERYRFGDCLIGEIELANGCEQSFGTKFLTIKGDADDGELHRNGRYRFYGRKTSYRNKRSGRDEQQFHFVTFVTATSHDRDGIVEYLTRAGQGLGMGRGTAEKLWKAFGSDAVKEIRQDPTILAKFANRISQDQCRAIGEILQAQKATEDATIELTGLLSGRGLPKTTARKAIKKWGNRAAEVIRRDPYALMAFRGCGFRLCDALWIELGLSPHRLRRQALAAWYAVASDNSGDTWFPVERVAQAVQASIGGTHCDPVRAIKLATRLAKWSPNHYGALAAIRTDGPSGPLVEGAGKLWLAEGKHANAERELARRVVDAIYEAKPTTITEYSPTVISWQEAAAAVQCHRCSRELTAPEVHVWNGKPFGPTCIQSISDGTDVEIHALSDWFAMQPPKMQSAIVQLEKRKDIAPFSLWPNPQEIAGIDAHQKLKLADALISRIAILGGSPGTGKTFTIAMLIKHMLKHGIVGPQDIAIGAPTGKAAVRITEAMQAAGVPLFARTWHSLLGVGKTDDEHGGWSFLHNEANPWPFRLIIGDECSMADTALMRSVFAARPRGCHMLLVGDVHQLAPVGTGAPLRDLINCQVVGYGELTEIKRNSGGIVEACASIRDGQPWEAGDNLLIKPVTPEQQLDVALHTIRQAQIAGHDPVWDCQIIVAVNSRSPLSRRAVNERLQAELNTNEPIAGTPFRLSDKIVCLKNGRYTAIEADDEAKAAEGGGNEVYVANGELGRVVDIEDKSIIARLTSPYRLIRIPRGKASESEGEDESSTGCSWDLAYGLTCHKLQGSEVPVAIVLIDEYPGARQVCDRSWLYTAISRAKKQCVLVGRKATAEAMCRRAAVGKRKTFLRELVQRSFTEKALESL